MSRVKLNESKVAGALVRMYVEQTCDDSQAETEDVIQFALEGVAGFALHADCTQEGFRDFAEKAWREVVKRRERDLRR